MRTLEMDREAMMASFRAILGDIETGGFARRFQDEAKHGYPMLEMARAMIHGDSPITQAETRLRQLGGLPAEPSRRNKTEGAKEKGSGADRHGTIPGECGWLNWSALRASSPTCLTSSARPFCPLCSWRSGQARRFWVGSKVVPMVCPP